MNKLVLYNGCNNGDVHVARSYIQDIANKYSGEVYYAIKPSFSSPLLSDISNIKQYFVSEEFMRDILHQSIVIQNDITYINTWFCQLDGKYFKQTQTENCNFTILYAIFTDVYKHLSLELDEYLNYIPKIDFQNLELDEQKRLIDQTSKFKSRILICSSDVKSGQAPNFDFTIPVDLLSAKYKDCCFLLTRSLDIKKENVIDISHYSLNQIAYISQYCNVIVGRSSGPYVFSIIKENVFDETKTFVCFCHDKIISLGLPGNENKCGLIWSNDFNESNIVSKIEEAIRDKCL